MQQKSPERRTHTDGEKAHSNLLSYRPRRENVSSTDSQNDVPKEARQEEFHRDQSRLSRVFIVISKVAEGISPVPEPFEPRIYRYLKNSPGIGSLPSHERCSAPFGQYCAQAAMARGGQHFSLIKYNILCQLSISLGI
jgi:hypothetical protein